jgi:hypothetical protein
MALDVDPGMLSSSDSTPIEVDAIAAVDVSPITGR